MAKRSFAKVKVKGGPRSFIVILVLVALLSLLAVFGLKIGDSKIIPGAGDIRFGIDIRGGVEAIFTPQDFEGSPTAEQMDAASRIINQRLDNRQILDREVIIGKDSDRITVRFPWRSDEIDFNPEEALLELGEMALLSFREPDGTIALTGADVKEARMAIDPNNNNPIILLELQDEGRDKFAEVTTRLSIGQDILAIYMDEDIISMPSVRVPILDGKAEISGSFTIESATDLAQTINAGALPFALKATSSSTISPSLGQDSLKVMVMSGITALAVLCLFMLLYYRLTGFAACISLILQISGILLAISIPQQTLTLQGIAGIILSLGMGVDANVIISERIREEIRSGDDLATALKNGFSRAFSPVFDSNVTVAVAAAMLMFFGSGSTLSFGYSLLAGVVMNAITGLWLTRLMIGSMSKMKSFKNPWLYGQTKKEKVLAEKGPFGFSKKVPIFASLSLLLILVGLLVSIFGGINLDIDFRGGSIINYSYEGEINLEEASSLVKAEIGREVRAQSIVSMADQREEISFNIAGNESLTPEQLEGIKRALDEKYPEEGLTLSSSQLVDPLIGREMLWNGLKAMLFAGVLIIIYIWYSFRSMSGPSAGVMAMMALLHDILIVFFFVVLSGKAINGTIIAVILTVLGYSINDTIVVYDRIRENIRLTGGTMPLDELVDKSIQQSLARTINTSVSTFLAVTVVFIFASIYGLSSIVEFALPMMFGIVIGTYPSLFMASPLWVKWKKRGGKTGYHSGARAVAILLAILLSITLVLSPAKSLQAQTLTEANNTNATTEDNSSLPAGTTDKKDEVGPDKNQVTEEKNEGTDADTSQADTSWASLDKVKAKSYIVVDASDMKILAEHEAKVRRPMASTTKILTALAVINHPDFALDRIVTVSKEAIVLPSSVSARVNLVAGEQLTTEECLYGLMVHSGNDCANVLAENYSPLESGGSIAKRDAFCTVATEYAKSLGAVDTSIKNPSGFTVEGHYSTAYDLALLAAEGLKDPIFRRLVSTSYFRMPATDKHPVAGWKILRNTNGLVLSSPELYSSKYFKSYDGVKTGTTSLAGSCLVGAGTTHDDRQIIGVLLNTELKVGSTSVTIDVVMRTLLEAGAEKLGVEPKEAIPGTSGIGFISLPVSLAKNEPAEEPTEIEPEPDETITPTDEEIENTESIDIKTDETIVQKEPEELDLDQGTGSSNLTLILLAVLILALVAILIYLGLSLRKDKRRRY